MCVCVCVSAAAAVVGGAKVQKCWSFFFLTPTTLDCTPREYYFLSLCAPPT
jgi:hypothetical protein